ncbi:MAG: hypothetical protein LC730_06080 [Acidobacteria bacterium]|nr:hypothetical protein [Acidobacteriota bacterium]
MGQVRYDWIVRNDTAKKFYQNALADATEVFRHPTHPQKNNRNRRPRILAARRR